MKKQSYLLFIFLFFFSCAESLNEDENKNDFSGESGTFVDERDGQEYKWVKIGEQIWMAENLAYLPSVSPASIRSADKNHYYVYDYNGENIKEAKSLKNFNTYGVLYNFSAATKEACPEEWHLPNNDEFKELELYLLANGFNYDGSISYNDSKNQLAKAMAAKTHWMESSSNSPADIGNNLSANNSSGFSGLPGGYLDEDGNFYGIGKLAVWMTSDKGNRHLTSHSSYIDRDGGISLSGAYSIRCIKN